MAAFTEYIDVLEALASAPGGLTAGQIRRQSGTLLDTQKVTRILKSLERDSMVWSSRVTYRPNVLKVVWRVRSVAVAHCSAVRSAYDENEGIHPPEPMTTAEYAEQQHNFSAALAARNDNFFSMKQNDEGVLEDDWLVPPAVAAESDIWPEHARVERLPDPEPYAPIDEKFDDFHGGYNDDIPF